MQIGREETFLMLNLFQYQTLLFSLSQYVKILCIVIRLWRDTHAKRLKVVIAAGLTSSHSEQRS